MKKTPGNDFEDSRRIQQPPSSRNTKARGAKPPTGQPKEGPQRYDDEKEQSTLGRIRDGVSGKGAIK